MRSRTATAHIKAPFVYVGHSLGANFAQIYAARYPGDVEALVLIEPGVPADLLEDFHGTHADALAMDTRCTAICIVGWIAGELGISRLVVNHIVTGSKGFANAPQAQAQYQASAARASASGVSVAYLNALPRIAVEVMRAKTSAPVLILASAIAPPPDDGETAADMVRWRQRQLAWFTQLAAQSHHGEGPVTIPGADHTTMVTGAGASRTVAAIRSFLARL
jgi:pimeloyl-ACP methyl ester carboxylesterase